jgi:hypothetical protein
MNGDYCMKVCTERKELMNGAIFIANGAHYIKAKRHHFKRI